jgi:hypothetical protein
MYNFVFVWGESIYIGVTTNEPFYPRDKALELLIYEYHVQRQLILIEGGWICHTMGLGSLSPCVGYTIIS